MQYLGGKSKIANQIATYLNNIRKPGQAYWEPFVGAGWILERIYTQPIFASDAHSQLIKMWQALQEGWIPPEIVTEADYQKARVGELPDHITAFIGFGCSYGGKWFGGFARGRGRNYAKVSSRRLLRKIKKVNDSIFFQANFMKCNPPQQGCLIYCDPPYNNTTSYKGVARFNTEQFWEHVRQLESNGHTVIVSEYKAPDDFGCVLEMTAKTGLKNKESKNISRIEKLFRLGEHPKFQGTLWD